MAYIYKITNDVNQKVYIGKTEFSIEKRFKEHCSDAFKERNEKRPLYDAMSKYGVEHFHVELIEETDNPEERETYWIEHFDSFKNGYNATLGGDGVKRIDYDEVIELYKQFGLVNHVAQKMQIGRDTVSKILKENGIEITSHTIVQKQLQGKRIGQYDKQTHELICTYDSIKDAARSLGKDHSHIGACANGKRKSAYGFVWQFI